MLVSYLSGYAFWLLLGLVLLISELLAPGLVAAFFGLGALTVGLLTLVGAIEGLAAQLIYFALISLAALFGLRRHFKQWLRGSEVHATQLNLDDTGVHGARVKVLSDFSAGVGAVQLNGAKWDAESSESLAAGDTAWVTGNKGIVLEVSRERPHTKR